MEKIGMPTYLKKHIRNRSSGCSIRKPCLSGSCSHGAHNWASHVGGTTGLQSAMRGFVSHFSMRGGFDVTAF